MGFSLKKIVKSVAPIVAPLPYLTSLGAKKGADAIAGGDIFAGKPGSGNPNVPPNMQHLFDTSGFDFLRNTQDNLNRFTPLRDATMYNDLLTNNPTNQYAASLPSRGKTFAGTYTAPNRISTGSFQDYISKINAPSSVDQVRSGIDSDVMKRLLEGVDQDVKGAAGSLKMDFQDRGLGGPGMASDIEVSDLGGVYSEGAKLKGDIRSQYALAELERQKAQEQAVREAYGQRYGADVGYDTQATDIASRGAMSDAQFYNDLLKSQAELGEGEAGRRNARDLAYADLKFKGNQAYTDVVSEREKLLAQLLNQRDLGAAGIQANLYDSAEERRQKYKEPSLFDKFLSGFAGSGGNSFGKSFFG